jgi:hypothetical protein
MMRDDSIARELARLPVPEHRPTFFDDLRTRLGEDARPRRTWLRLPYAVAGAAAVAALAVLVVELTTRAEPASAVDVRAAVDHALATVDTIQGMLVVREHLAGGELRWRFVLDTRGDFWAAAEPEGPVWAYDAREGVERNSDAGSFTVRRGIAPGPPDATSSAWMVQRDLGAVVRALDAAGDASVEEIDYGGRPAWRLETQTQNAGELREVTVDRETGVPVRDVRTYRGTRSEWRIDGLEANVAVHRDAFQLPPTGGQQVTAHDYGFRPTALGDVQAAVGYRPLVPSWVPAGYERTNVAVARSTRPTGSEQRPNPPSRHVVSIAYRRGLDLLVVTTRRIAADRSRWTDPVTVGEPSRAPAAVSLRGGPVAGGRV